MTVFDGAQAEAGRVFLSYSSIDRIRTNGLGLLLEGLGHRVFHDHRTIKPGMKWEAALQDGLDEADALMVFWTKHAARSDWVRKEYEYFYATFPDRPLVPVLGDETPLPDILKTRQHADFAPVVNEVLEIKRKMKKQGAGAAEIEQAVVQRLEEAGVEIKTKKQRRMLALFLGFGWLFTLLRNPLASAQKAGRAAVEKTAQMTAGQVAAIGVAAVVGLAAGGPVADSVIGRVPDGDAVATPISLESPANTPVEESGPASGDASPISLESGVPTWLLAMGDTLWRFREGILESHDTTNLYLAAISQRLDELALGQLDSLAACQQENAVLRDDLAELENALADSETGAVDPPERPVVDFPQPTAAEGAQNIFFVPLDVGGEIVSPIPLQTPRPDYPSAAEDRGVEGTVTVLARIDENGDVTVESADGHPLLTDSARRAVETWKFSPGTRDGQPIPRRFTVRIRFALRG